MVDEDNKLVNKVLGQEWKYKEKEWRFDKKYVADGNFMGFRIFDQTPVIERKLTSQVPIQYLILSPESIFHIMKSRDQTSVLLSIICGSNVRGDSGVVV